MKLEDQVCSLELAKRLKELGVRRESAFYWIGHYINTTDCVEKPETARLQLGDYGTEYMWKYPAFTVAELGEMLPGHFGMDWFLQFWKTDLSGPAIYSINYKDPKTEGESEIGWMRQTIIEPKEADARAKMLIHLIEKGIVKP